jgi:hypothetical protein
MSYGRKFQLDLSLAFASQPTEAVEQAFKLLREYDTDREIFRLLVLEHPAAQRRERECYHPPSNHDLLMAALDSLLGTHGCESIGECDTTQGPPIEYLNTGDSYAATLVYYRDTDRFKVESYADAVERAERKGWIEA